MKIKNNEYNDNRSGVVSNKYHLGDIILYNKKKKTYKGSIIQYYDNFGTIYYEVLRHCKHIKVIDTVNESDIIEILHSYRYKPKDIKENDIYIKLK